MTRNERLKIELTALLALWDDRSATARKAYDTETEAALIDKAKVDMDFAVARAEWFRLRLATAEE